MTGRVGSAARTASTSRRTKAADRRHECSMPSGSTASCSTCHATIASRSAVPFHDARREGRPRAKQRRVIRGLYQGALAQWSGQMVAGNEELRIAERLDRADAQDDLLSCLLGRVNLRSSSPVPKRPGRPRYGSSRRLPDQLERVGQEHVQGGHRVKPEGLGLQRPETDPDARPTARLDRQLLPVAGERAGGPRDPERQAPSAMLACLPLLLAGEAGQQRGHPGGGARPAEPGRRGAHRIQRGGIRGAIRRAAEHLPALRRGPAGLLRRPGALPRSWPGRCEVSRSGAPQQAASAIVPVRLSRRLRRRSAASRTCCPRTPGPSAARPPGRPAWTAGAATGGYGRRWPRHRCHRTT